jgi:hypothetical protein
MAGPRATVHHDKAKYRSQLAIWQAEQSADRHDQGSTSADHLNLGWNALIFRLPLDRWT